MAKTIRLKNADMTVKVTSRVRERKPQKRLVKVGELVIDAQGKGGGAVKQRLVWKVYRRGIKRAKHLQVNVSKRFRKLKKWPKYRKKQRLYGTVRAKFNLGYGVITNTYKIFDRGPKSVRGRLTKYTVVKTVKGLRPYRGKKVKGRVGSPKTRSFNTIRECKAFIKKEIKRLKRIKTKAPEYVIISPSETKSKAKTKSGYPSIKAVRAELRSIRRFEVKKLKQLDKRVRQYLDQQKMSPGDDLRKLKKLSRTYRRSVRKVKAPKGMKIEVRSYTKRGDKEPRALSEVLAHKMVRWYVKPPGAKKGRWQSVIFTMIRWGQARKVKPPYAPSYSVVDEDGKDIIFAVKQGSKTQDPADKIVQENFEKVIYTTRPRQRARAELKKKVKHWVKMLGGAMKKVGWKNVTGSSSERIGNVRLKILKLGLKKNYPTLYATNKYAYLGGAGLELYKGRRRTPFKTIQYSIARVRHKKDQKKLGKVVILRNNRVLKKGYSSSARARNALRGVINDQVYKFRLKYGR